MSDYSQGMNDLLAPIFIVFLTEQLNTSFFAVENNLREFESKFTDEIFMNVS